MNCSSTEWNNKNVGSIFSFNKKKHQSLPMCHDLWRFFSPYVLVTEYPRLHELIARIAIQQFQGERSSWYSTGHFYGTPTQTSPHFFSGKSHPKWCKSNMFFCIKVGSHTTKMGGNFMTPVLIIGCLWFSYCSCLSHEVPLEHTLKKKRTIFVIRS